MKNLLFTFCMMLSSSLFAGGTSGGVSGVISSKISDTFLVDSNEFSRITTDALNKINFEFEGEELEMDNIDFTNRALTLRTLKGPLRILKFSESTLLDNSSAQPPVY